MGQIIWLQAKVRDNLHRRQQSKDSVVGRNPVQYYQEDSQEICNFSLYSNKTLLDDPSEGASDKSVLHVISVEKLDCQTPLQSALRLQRWWRQVLDHRHNAATIIQKHFRGWRKHTAFVKAKLDIIHIQVCFQLMAKLNRLKFP